jgi:signal transduction histidine kinase
MYFEKEAGKVNMISCDIQEGKSVSTKHKCITVFREMPVGVLLTNSDYCIEYCNPAFSAIMGFQNEDLYGLPMEDVLCCSLKDDENNRMDMAHADYPADEFTCRWNTKLNLEKQIRCKRAEIDLDDGSFKGFAWYIEDLTFSFEQKGMFCDEMNENGSQVRFQRQMKIAGAISFISSILVAPENVDEAIVSSLQRTGEVTGASRAYLFRFDYDSETMSNTHEWCAGEVEPQKDLLQDLPLDMFPWWMAKLNHGEIIHVKEVSSMPTEAAAEKEILEMQDINSVLVLPLHIFGKVAGFVGLDDVTETGEWSMEDVTILSTVANTMGSALGQKEIEIKLNERNQRLEKAYNDLKKVEIMKDEFISNLSHELRTPLYPIQGYSDILLEEEIGPLNQKQKKSLSAIAQNSKKLGSLIDSLLYMGSVLAGKTHYHFEKIQMKNVIDNAIQHYLFDAQKKNIEISKEIIDELPMIRGDVVFLPQLLYKLIDNAIKFTPKEGKITIRCFEKDDGIKLEVRDNGIGIPEENIEDIFNIFYQVDGSSTRRYGGTGIGLHIAKKIVDAHGGRIWIGNNGKKGTVVHIFLPGNNNTAEFLQAHV